MERVLWSDILQSTQACLLPVEYPVENWPAHALPLINANTAADALQQLQWLHEQWGLQAAHVRIWAKAPWFIDGEGVLETIRLLTTEGFHVAVTVPLDWACCMRAADLGALLIEIQHFVPDIEQERQRPNLVQRIINDCPVPAFTASQVGAVKRRQLCWQAPTETLSNR